MEHIPRHDLNVIETKTIQKNSKKGVRTDMKSVYLFFGRVGKTVKICYIKCI